jgi:hypothetical protein
VGKPKDNKDEVFDAATQPGSSLKPNIRALADPAAQGSPRNPVKTGHKGHRLSPVPVRSPEVQERMARAREPKPVTVRRVAPETLGAPLPTRKQLEYIIDLENELEITGVPLPTTKGGASRRIKQLRALKFS